MTISQTVPFTYPCINDEPAVTGTLSTLCLQRDDVGGVVADAPEFPGLAGVRRAARGAAARQDQPVQQHEQQLVRPGLQQEQRDRRRRGQQQPRARGGDRGGGADRPVDPAVAGAPADPDRAQRAREGARRQGRRGHTVQAAGPAARRRRRQLPHQVRLLYPAVLRVHHRLSWAGPFFGTPATLHTIPTYLLRVVRDQQQLRRRRRCC